MFSGNFRSFAGISEESMWLTVVFSIGCNFVPGVSCILVLGFRGFPAIREHVFTGIFGHFRLFSGIS